MNAIGLDKQKSKHLAGMLNVLLANYSIFYQNARGFHWNIKGDKFFELHVKFEELYNDLLLKIDEVAEVSSLSGLPPNIIIQTMLKYPVLRKVPKYGWY